MDDHDKLFQNRNTYLWQKSGAASRCMLRIVLLVNTRFFQTASGTWSLFTLLFDNYIYRHKTMDDQNVMTGNISRDVAKNVFVINRSRRCFIRMELLEYMHHDMRRRNTIQIKNMQQSFSWRRQQLLWSFRWDTKL